MFATYRGAKRLNVRSNPAVGADVTRRLEPGEIVRVDLVESGWARCGDGWLRADLVTITDEEPKPGDEAGIADAAPVAKAAEKEGPAKEDLSEKTAAELRALAKARGIKVTSRMTKPEIIALLDA